MQHHFPATRAKALQSLPVLIENGNAISDRC